MLDTQAKSVPPSPARSSLLFRHRVVLGCFMAALVISGLTAFPLQYELDAVTSALGLNQVSGASPSGSLDSWLMRVHDGLHDTYGRYPWVAYGTDWLAFAHIVIAVFFIGPLVDPVRNVWVLWAGLIACALVLPLALICGPVRGIPPGWRVIDCSFGVIGAIPLLYCLRATKVLADRG